MRSSSLLANPTGSWPVQLEAALLIDQGKSYFKMLKVF
jgi:hypothetical protein